MKPPVLSVQHLDIHYTVSGQTVQAVQDVSFDLFKGETTAVLGESGSGKSTLGRSLLGLLGDSCRIVNGSITLENDSRVDYVSAVETLWKQVRGKKIAMIFQDPQQTLNPLMTVFDQMHETLNAFSRVSRKKARQIALTSLEKMRLDEPEKVLKSYPFQLSGGMCQRVVIAISLLNDPDILIADEPTTALDPDIQSDILDQLKALSKTRDLSLLLITHDIEVAARTADRMLVMKSGRVVESGPADQLIQAPEHAYTRTLLACRPSLYWSAGKDGPIEPGDCVIHGKDCPNLGSRNTDKELLRVEQLSYHYKVKGFIGTWSVPVLDDVSFNVQKGEIIGLIGRSGSGKSTLARCLLGLLKVSQGDVFFKGRRISRLKGSCFRRECRLIQPVFQQARGALNPHRTLSRIIREPLDYHGVGNNKSRNERVQRVAEQVGLEPELLDRRTSQISTGQCQRVAIARALVIEPELLICDEPTSALDLSIQAQILDLLLSLKASLGFGMVLISHDMEVVNAICDRVLITRNGRLQEWAA